MRAWLLAAACIAAVALATGAEAQERVTLRMMGLPLASGNIQKNLEQPFFAAFAERSGLPVSVDFKPLESTGIKEFEQLRVLKSGIFDMALLRMGQNSRDEPALIGIDLIGLNDSYATAKKVVSLYKAAVSERLEKRFATKLLAVWGFGPQIIFCKPAVKSLKDLKGLKIRVIDGVMAKFLERSGAIPVTMPVAEVSQGLALGTIDCGITGSSTANTAGWAQTVTSVYPLSLQFAMQGYVITLAAWNKLAPDQQQKLQAAIDKLTDDIWTYSEELHEDGMRCNLGQDPCTTGRKYKLTTSPVTAEDVAMVKAAVREISYPAWQPVCDASAAGCSESWRRIVGPLVGME
jgi:TRAP-type C4-dicarboxylate transport system substrate-binding protein